jgi:hypothetical protein
VAAKAALAAAKAAKVLLGCFRSGEANDPEVYTTAVIATLARYPAHIVRAVCDPVNGLPSRAKFLPTISELRQDCERLQAREARIAAMRAQAQRTLAERRAAAAAADARKRRPTLDELRAKYGPNWGLTGGGGATHELDADARRRRMELTLDANRRQFVKECKRAGVSPDAFISPTLVQIIRGGS